ncbi:hypothetical protein FM131_00305 [Weissella confusa]|nr:hypothetical protein FM131_00305 [Weissella confusa]
MSKGIDLNKMGAYQVDFKRVTMNGLENAVVPEALAGYLD